MDSADSGWKKDVSPLDPHSVMKTKDQFPSFKDWNFRFRAWICSFRCKSTVSGVNLDLGTNSTNSTDWGLALWLSNAFQTKDQIACFVQNITHTSKHAESACKYVTTREHSILYDGHYEWIRYSFTESGTSALTSKIDSFLLVRIALHKFQSEI